jgi:hypothetical protein
MRAMILVVALAVVTTGAVGCRRSPPQQAPAKEASTQEGEGKRAVDWNKATRDAERMQEKSRQRAERQRQQALDKANKAPEQQ